METRRRETSGGRGRGGHVGGNHLGHRVDVQGRFAARATAEPAAAASASSVDDYVSAPDSGTATVSGTSTLHDWSAKSTTVAGTVKSSGPWTGAAPTLQSIQLSIPADSLKSSEGSDMDDKIHDALKAKANPLITFTLSSAKFQSAPSTDDPKYHYAASGKLTVAGASHSVNLTLDIQPSKGDMLTIETQTPLKMTDFGIQPPTAMLGMIKSGNKVTVNVVWQLVRRKP